MPVRRYLTYKEIKALSVFDFGQTDNLVFQIGLASGLRASEMVNIRIANITRNGFKIWDEKKDVYRDIVYDDWLHWNIQIYLSETYKPLNGVKIRDRKLFNFTTKTLNRKVQRAFVIANIQAPARWHTFRHTYVRLMLDHKGDQSIQFICEQTGDSPSTILKYYGIPSIDERIGQSIELRQFINDIKDGVVD